jgi:hypothetical protein
VLSQSMGSIKIHKDQVNRVIQTRARLEARLKSNNESFGSFVQTPESYIQSDVFVCSFLLNSFHVIRILALRVTPISTNKKHALNT